MFAIVVYDVKEKRVSKVMKICRRYLMHKQRSVFEGMITEAKLERLKKELEGVVDCGEDAICIYRFDMVRYSRKEEIGVASQTEHVI